MGLGGWESLLSIKLQCCWLSCFIAKRLLALVVIWSVGPSQVGTCHACVTLYSQCNVHHLCHTWPLHLSLLSSGHQLNLGPPGYCHECHAAVTHRARARDHGGVTPALQSPGPGSLAIWHPGSEPRTRDDTILMSVWSYTFLSCYKPPRTVIKLNTIIREATEARKKQQKKDVRPNSMNRFFRNRKYVQVFSWNIFFVYSLPFPLIRPLSVIVVSNQIRNLGGTYTLNEQHFFFFRHNFSPASVHTSRSRRQQISLPILQLFIII